MNAHNKLPKSDKVKMSPDFKESEEMFDSYVQDIACSVPAHLPDVEEDSVEIAGHVISVNSSLGEREIKNLLECILSPL